MQNFHRSNNLKRMVPEPVDLVKITDASVHQHSKQSAGLLQSRVNRMVCNNSQSDH
jgi:hypothetical protein